MGLSYCADQVRQRSHFDYQLCVLAGAKHQDALFSLFAFDGEVAKIPMVTSEAIIGLIRLQWWRDAIEEIYNGTPRKHPVVEALAQTVRERSLPRELFDLYLLHREWEIQPEDQESSVHLDDYFDQVFGGFNHLLLLTVNPQADKPTVAVARDSGAQWGRLDLLARLTAEKQSSEKKILVMDGEEELEGSFEVLPDFVRSRFLDASVKPTSTNGSKSFPAFARNAVCSSIAANLKSSTDFDVVTELSLLASRGAMPRLLWHRMTGK